MPYQNGTWLWVFTTFCWCYFIDGILPSNGGYALSKCCHLSLGCFAIPGTAHASARLPSVGRCCKGEVLGSQKSTANFGWHPNSKKNVESKLWFTCIPRILRRFQIVVSWKLVSWSSFSTPKCHAISCCARGIQGYVALWWWRCRTSKICSVIWLSRGPKGCSVRRLGEGWGDPVFGCGFWKVFKLKICIGIHNTSHQNQHDEDVEVDPPLNFIWWITGAWGPPGCIQRGGSSWGGGQC